MARDSGGQPARAGREHEDGGYLRHRRGFRERHPETPLVLMGYANPMIARGSQWFADACAEAGVDGIICVDIPSEEDAEIGLRCAKRHRLHPPRHADHRCRAPARRARRVQRLSLLRLGRGDHRQATGPVDQHRGSRRAPEGGTDLPVVVGFGVRTPEQAADIARHGDGVVVGSAIVDLVAQHGADAPGPVRDLVASLAEAVHQARVISDLA
jgi:tryptophan synthase alpha chain